MWITMVKKQYVVIIIHVDMNLIVVCERIMKLQPEDGDEQIIRFRRRLVPIVDTVLEEFKQTYHHLLHCFPDVSSLFEPVARIEEIRTESLVCIVLRR